MQKYTINIDPSKITKSKITERSYTNRDGQEVTVKDYKMDVIIQDQNKHKKIYSGNNADLFKVGFVVEAQSKEEREAKADSNYIGEILQWINNGGQQQQQSQPQVNEIDYPESTINPDDIPF